MPEWQLKHAPYAHQQEAFERSAERPYFALFMEMGTGKTAVALATAAHLIAQNKIDGMLVIAPKAVARNWLKEEFPKHWPEAAKFSQFLWRNNENDYRKFMTAPESFKALVVGAEAIGASDVAQSMAAHFVKNRRTLLVVDESTCIKNPKAKRSKVVHKLSGYCPYRRVLTGSPVSQNPLDLWSQVHVLRPPFGEWPYTNYYAMRAIHAVTKKMRVNGNRQIEIVVGYRNVDKINHLLNLFSFRIRKEECLTLPPKVYMRREVEMTPEQSAMYEQIRSEGFITLSTQQVVAPTLAMTLLTKLHQIVIGNIIDASGTANPIKNNRMRALLDTVEEMEGPVVIWSTYRACLQEIAATLDKEYPHTEKGRSNVCLFYGGSDKTERGEGLDAFGSGERRFFVGNPQTGGYGLTFAHCSNVIYFNNGYSLEQRVQSEDRCHRIGQTKTVTYVDLVSPKTVDDKVLTALLKKSKLAFETLGDDWKGWFEKDE